MRATPRYLWESREHRGRRVIGRLTVEGPTRAAALEMLRHLADQAPGAAGDHARRVLALDDANDRRHTMHRIDTRRVRCPYAAQDGAWRGWSYDDWTVSPPRAYASWQPEVR